MPSLMNEHASPSTAYDYVSANPGSFESTRLKNKVPFWPSIIQGSAADGGLLVPSAFARLTPDWIVNELPDLTPAEIATVLLRGYVPPDAISDTDLRAMMDEALNFDFPLEQLDDTTYILRLDQGPTASFKDIAARTLAALMECHCNKHQTPINLVVATSGDTGVAIQDAFANSAWITVTVLYPNQGVSNVQEHQMLDAPLRSKNVQSIPVDGNFDFAQDIAKFLQSLRGVNGLLAVDRDARISTLQKDARDKLGEIMSNEDILTLASTIDSMNLSSANSINVWRLLPQMTQYFHGYGKMLKEGKIKPGEEVVFSVPSGNTGHLMAGIYAKEMGLPIRKFIAGTNANNIFAYVIGKGVIKHKGFVNTQSPAMDILDPSNVERLLTHAATKTNFSGSIDFVSMKRDIKELDAAIKLHTKALQDLNGDPANTLQRQAHESALKKIFSTPGIELKKYHVTDEMMQYLQDLIWAEDITDDEVLTKMAEEASKPDGLLLEAHGAIGVLAAEKARNHRRSGITEDTRVIAFETAHPHKFPESLGLANIPANRVAEISHERLAILAQQPLPERPEMVRTVGEIAQRIWTLAEAAMTRRMEGNLRN